MRVVWKRWRPAVVGVLIMTMLLGVVYTGLVTGIGQALFHGQANGSMVTVTLADGSTRTYGSSLIAQTFTEPKYLVGRPSEASNLSPTSEEQADAVAARVQWWHDFDPGNTADIPMDLVTGSGSGVDPSVSPAGAQYQVARIARERNLSEAAVEAVIAEHTTGRFLGIFGEPTVNVLMVNLDLDGLLAH